MASSLARVNFFMSARSRIVYDKQTTVAGALLGVQDSDENIQNLEQTFAVLYGTAQMKPLDAIEHMIAQCVDAGDGLPVSNPEGFAAAEWIAQVGLSALPNPVPRGFVIYLAKAFKDEGAYPTMEAALTNILTTKEFV